MSFALEAGNILSQLAPHEIDLKNQSLHEIEGAVENWKQQALPEIEAVLVNRSSKPFYSRDKKTKNLVVTARDWCGLKRYTENSYSLYKNTNLMQEKLIIWL